VYGVQWQEDTKMETTFASCFQAETVDIIAATCLENKNISGNLTVALTKSQRSVAEKSCHGKLFIANISLGLISTCWTVAGHFKKNFLHIKSLRTVFALTFAMYWLCWIMG